MILVLQDLRRMGVGEVRDEPFLAVAGPPVISLGAGARGLLRLSPSLPLTDVPEPPCATLGYGDITPATAIAKIIVVIEVILNYLMGGIFIAILTRRFLG